MVGKLCFMIIYLSVKIFINYAPANTVKKASKVMLPLECQYLNKQALHETAGQVSQLERLFQIKRKPKSAALRAEIMTKGKCLCFSLLTLEFLLAGTV